MKGVRLVLIALPLLMVLASCQKTEIPPLDLASVKQNKEIIHNPVKNDIFFEDQFSVGPDYFKPDLTNYYDQVGTVWVEGYAVKKYPAASRDFDCVDFVVSSFSDTVKTMLLARTHQFEMVDGQQFLKLMIEIPHRFDPTHVVENSTLGAKVAVVLLLYPSPRMGGFNLENAVLMFQPAADIHKNYVEEYSDGDYDKVENGE